MNLPRAPARGISHVCTHALMKWINFCPWALMNSDRGPLAWNSQQLWCTTTITKPNWIKINEITSFLLLSQMTPKSQNRTVLFCRKHAPTVLTNLSQICGQWRFEEESRDPPPPRGSQARRWMKRMAWVPLKGYPRITQSQIILTYPGLYKSGHFIPTYPGISKSRHCIPTYPGLSQSTFPIPGYPGLSWCWLAQGVAFPEVHPWHELIVLCIVSTLPAL